MMKSWYDNLPINRKVFIMLVAILVSVLIIATVIQVGANYLYSYQRIIPKTQLTAIEYFDDNELLALPDDATYPTKNWLAFITSVDRLSYLDQVGLIKQDQFVHFYSKKTLESTPLVSELPVLDHWPYRYLQYPLGNGYKLYFRANVFYEARSINHIFGATTLTFLLTFFILIYAGFRIEKFISRPIIHLMNIARMVSANENYRVRAQKLNNDEIGGLVDAFNSMLERIENRDQQLLAEKDKAEKTQIQAQDLAEETREANKRLEFEVHVRTKIERKLTDFQGYLNSIINSMPSALIAVDEHFFITQWNKGASQLSGTAIENALGYSLEEAFPFLNEYMDLISRALIEKEIQGVEKMVYEQEDNRYFLDLMVYPLHRAGTLGAVIRIDNITDRMQLEEVMVQTEKMMSVGGLAAGMAHEINNPLSAIVQGSQNVIRRIDPSLKKNRKVADELEIDLDKINAYLEEREIVKFIGNIQSAGQRAAHIVTNMLQFSRQSNNQLDANNINELLDRTLEIASSDYDLKKGFDFKHLDIVKEYKIDQFFVPCASTEIEQVVLNLLKNAAQAIKERIINGDTGHTGRIVIRCFEELNECVIQIEDNGSGMSEDTRKRIFEPFFTTKDIGIGTGLGLSVSYFIITSHHNGSMDASSQKDIGTTFTIRLPLVQPKADQ